jgi:transposase InsO family protein
VARLKAERDAAACFVKESIEVSLHCEAPGDLAVDGLCEALHTFEAAAPNRKWIADFCVGTAEGWLYVIDLFSRRVVGWSMSAAMTAELVTVRRGYRSGAASSLMSPPFSARRRDQVDRGYFPAWTVRVRPWTSHRPVLD